MPQKQDSQPMQNTFPQPHPWLIFFLVSIVSLLLFGALTYFEVPPLADENHHVKQIDRFLNGNFHQLSTLTTIPGYHAVLAILAKASTLHELAHLRAFSLILGLAAVGVFYACARRNIPERAAQRTLAFFLLPIFFPYLALVYMHSLSMLLILLGVLCYLKKRHLLVPLFLGLSVLARQTNIIWVLMFLTMLYFDTRKEHHKPSAWFKTYRGVILSYGAVMASFVIFVLWNGGVALGDRDKHQPGLRIENIAFFLYLFFLLFWPFLIANTTRILSQIKQHTLIVTLCSLSFALLYVFFFKVSHPYNSPDIFLHNRLIENLHSTPSNTLLSLVPILPALWGLFSFRLQQRSFYLLYLFGTLALLPFDLIEHRYYIPIVTLFLLWKAPEETRFEWALTGYFFLLSLTLCLALPLAGVFP
ncbi:MAG: hypothetical protein GY801_16885 [bacterium]|nr:hypothetical protein [bacterium]